jgi:hypothetical protein
MVNAILPPRETLSLCFCVFLVQVLRQCVLFRPKAAVSQAKSVRGSEMNALFAADLQLYMEFFPFCRFKQRPGNFPLSQNLNRKDANP